MELAYVIFIVGIVSVNIDIAIGWMSILVLIALQ